MLREKHSMLHTKDIVAEKGKIALYSFSFGGCKNMQQLSHYYVESYFDLKSFREIHAYSLTMSI